MPEIVSDNDPFQLPQAAADAYYARTDPGLPAFVAATLGDGPTAYLLRGAQRGTVEGSSFFDRFLASTGNRDPEAEMFGQTAETVQSPDMAPADYNEKYAPRDTTGAVQPIGDQPMPEALAAIIGQEKSDAMQREGVLRRYATATEWVKVYNKNGSYYLREQPVHGWFGTFLAGTAAPMLDPLNAASLFVPGVGEG